ncbi:MAG TPA: thiol reductant ABC exporter subunit CydC [Devosiaceae bacterium]|nr:thiol reductant ABC exporter subunit CydC [Devosiaceae bacterium]
MNDILRLLRLFWPYRRWLAAGIALSVVVILSNVVLLALAGWFIASMALAGLGTQAFGYFTPAAAIRGLAILRTVARYLERLVTHDATLRVLSELRVWFYRHLEPLAPARLQNYRGGDLLSRIRGDIDSLDNFYLQVLAPTVSAAITSVALVAGLALFSGRVALIDALGLLAAGIALPLLALRLGRRPGNRLVGTKAALRAATADTCRGLGELRVYAATARQGAQVEELSEALLADQRRLSWIKGLSAGLSGLFGQLTMWLALVVTIPLVTQGRTPSPDLAMIALYVLASFEAIAGLPLAFYLMGETLAAARRIFEIIDAAPELAEPPEGPLPQRFDIVVRDLRMRYAPDGKWVLDGLDFALRQGGSLGIVGVTGAGKSTLFNVLLRFREFQNGQIEIGGVPLRALQGEQIRALCSVVAQRGHLFNTTIRENLLLARPDASERDLVEALRQAGVFDEVESFSEGLDTFVGEVGARLSGGQARRIAIARAFLKDAPILLLDEPTEGLDAASERVVLEALKRLMTGRTTLLISHRAQALLYVDRVMRIEGASGGLIRLQPVPLPLWSPTADATLLTGLRHPASESLFGRGSHRSVMKASRDR